MSAPTASPENESLTPSSVGAESPPPPPRPPPPHHRLRPPISLKMPINNQSIYSGPQTAFIYGTAPIVIPMTPTGGHPLSQQDVAFSLLQAYPNKASEFMFKQFEGFRDFTMNTAKSGLSVGEKLAFWMYGKMRHWSRKWFTHFFLLLVVCAYSLLGAFMFVAVEGEAEQKSFKDMRQSRRELLHKIHKILIDVGKLESIHDEKEWMGRAMAEMISYEVDVIDQFKRGPVDRAEKPLWNFWSAVFYCGTIYTTIGYGHISPSTTTGRALTIVYAIFGIPMFLILLADFGKLFTRGIKFIWAFVRRVYYTGSCRKVRRTVPVQEVMKGVQMVYDIATFRRPSQLPPGVDLQNINVNDSVPPLPPRTPYPHSGTDPPGTPALSTFAVDDEFNLPISVAIFILVVYIFCGATVFYIWEKWGFFESFYFVFISMSTIGFGDFVPQNQMYMMASIVYLVFGLALTSMCINVVQEKLSDTFRQASAKIGATIGLQVQEDDGSVTPAPPHPVELAEVHTSTKKQSPKNEAFFKPESLEKKPKS